MSILWTDTAKRSSNIARVGYQPPSESLILEFKSGGVYRYANVAPAQYRAFLAQPSLGQAFNRMFYGRPKEHPSEKLEPTSGH